jgi:hypothetical protein
MALVARAKSILFSPKRTWRIIDAEFTKPGVIWGRYIIPLAAIGPIATAISWMVFGKPVPLTTLSNPVSLTAAVTRGVAEWVLALIAVAVLVQVLAAMAPGFGGQKNDVQALKGVAYSHTAMWIGGVFALVPALWPVKWLFYLYTFVLVFGGIGIVMKVPASQQATFGAVAALVAFIVFLLVRAILTVF